MTAESLATVASAMADTTRARMLIALMDARAWTAKELAAHAGVAASTATEHVNRLVTAGLVTERRQGRHRYVELADARVAEVLESLAALGQLAPTPPRGMREAVINDALARGRTCYDHLAGRLGVTVTQALVQRGLLDDTLTLTGDGRQWLTDALGSPFEPGRRAATRACLDWTERRDHLAGAAGAHIATVMFARGWIRRIGSSRAVVVTPAGSETLEQLLGIEAGSQFSAR
ncbi:winged helix-turn-helix transcriptional regulator [Mycobacterium sp. CBMA293]|uniref:ArsR/SmtB family transcription factor n=1 Tax=unclassified Mycolicibacterium TaxID=2636767 RepID=UPI0012DEB5F4|nr:MULTISPECIES: winged helix-turn-helix domain-containing protein [unclassified Mycolicibacterium]MUL47216.1 winged helix-turn-helix transcriptional regulator [Mycolicibacterium sp. CBMA 360]MUL61325.1 winged helix-turn-helix transcriptional regulator [Mycolicibacterium sp. CBMA 335]MUL72060.1 winged helix-turn-helix transcriptional regulator [Mycolicibacterium sp. CBMA 311]MUL96227.1 winged helix-turn-helix transcriptional regulator [Mycolicibacterium sp. CBMA 230]MUM08949.1 transcriptional 